VHEQHGDAPVLPGPPGPVVQRDLRRALQTDELRLHYQPQVDLRTGSVLGLEALLRWQHPEHGLLAPAAFLPAAEQSELIEPLTAWVVDRALRDHRDWTAAGQPWSVSVNVSARNLGTPALVDVVRQALARTGTPGHRLCLEVTETALAADLGAAMQILAELAGVGVTVSLDDFGTGYTSLEQLRTAPVAEIKIDRVFVADLPASAPDRAIVRSVIALAHGLGCTVTAEGVETEAAARWLTEAGCDQGQGYFYARPVPWPELATPAPLVPAPPLPLGQDTRTP
jgi:EAL domain-containing protein (putative c-di-GMP-specific phosphodiesterase class I)